MTRQRKEIIKKIRDLEIQEVVDLELGCGYRATDFGLDDLFEEARRKLDEELAATYGLTAKQYEAMQYEISSRLPERRITRENL